MLSTLYASDSVPVRRASNHRHILRDTLVADAQAKVEHFEIACYRALITGAAQKMELGEEAVGLLEENLRQEEERTARMAEPSTPRLVQKSMQSS